MSTTGVAGRSRSYPTETLLVGGVATHRRVRRACAFRTDRIDRFSRRHRDAHDLRARPVADLLRDLGARSQVEVSFEARRSPEGAGAASPPPGEPSSSGRRRREGVSAVAARPRTVDYRGAYGLVACSALPSDHEPPRRGESFVSRTIARPTGRTAVALQDKVSLGNVAAEGTRGFAGDDRRRAVAEAPAGARAPVARAARPGVPPERRGAGPDDDGEDRPRGGSPGADALRGAAGRPGGAMTPESRVYVAGHRGLVGSAVVRALEGAGYRRLLVRTRRELDLADRAAVGRFFDAERPEYVVVAAAKVGGILANATYPADFIRENLAIALNVIDAAYRASVTKLVFLGSSCIYPKLAPQPLEEASLLTGPLEPTNEPYAVAKIAGIELCRAYNRQHGTDFVSLLPANLYGPGDDFDLATSHVLPALIRKLHEAKVGGEPHVVVWGTGRPRREFLHVDDLADACRFVLERVSARGAGPEGDLFNVGVGEDLSIADLAALVREVVGYTGQIVYDESKPDGTPRKLLDVSRLAARGWRARIPLRDGIASTYRWFLAHTAQAR